MCKWNDVNDILPRNDTQTEVLFYANPFEWWTGLYTPKGFCGQKENEFAAHYHFDDDSYRVIDGVKFWIEIPRPVK